MRVYYTDANGCPCYVFSYQLSCLYSKVLTITVDAKLYLMGLLVFARNNFIV